MTRSSKLSVGAIAALLIGLQLLPGPKAGAAPMSPPLPLTATITSVASCVGTSCTVTFTANTNEVAGAFVYLSYPTDPGITFSAKGFVVNPGTPYVFTESNIPCADTRYEIDVPFSTDLWTPGPGTFDVDNSGTLPGACTPVTPPTTVPVTPPAPAPTSPGSVGQSSSPVLGPTPAAIPAAPAGNPPAAVTNKPLAFTGLNVLPLLEAGLGLIAAGVLALRLRKRLAR